VSLEITYIAAFEKGLTSKGTSKTAHAPRPRERFVRMASSGDQPDEYIAEVVSNPSFHPVET
jgi:hypothetical protein